MIKGGLCDVCVPGERWPPAVARVRQSAMVGRVPGQRSARVLPLGVQRRLPTGQVSPAVCLSRQEFFLSLIGW